MSVERFVKVKNDELKQLLVELKEADKKIVEITDEIEVKDKERGIVLVDRQKIIDRMKPIVNAECTGMLEEYEVLASLDIDTMDAEEVSVKIVNELESWKEAHAKAKEVASDIAPKDE